MRSPPTSPLVTSQPGGSRGWERQAKHDRVRAHPDDPAHLHRRDCRVTSAPGTVRDVIAGLDADYPGIGGRLLDEAGQLRRFVNVYVDDDDIRLAQGLDTQ